MWSDPAGLGWMVDGLLALGLVAFIGLLKFLDLYKPAPGDRNPLFAVSRHLGEDADTRARWYRFDSRDPGDGEARKRRRAWLFVGLVAAAVMTAVAVGPQVPPLGAPQMVAGTGDGTVGPLKEPAIYRPCRTMAWVVRFGECKPQVEPGREPWASQAR